MSGEDELTRVLLNPKEVDPPLKRDTIFSSLSKNPLFNAGAGSVFSSNNAMNTFFRHGWFSSCYVFRSPVSLESINDCTKKIFRLGLVEESDFFLNESSFNCVILNNLLIQLEVPSKDRSYQWVLQWISKQATTSRSVASQHIGMHFFMISIVLHVYLRYNKHYFIRC